MGVLRKGGGIEGGQELSGVEALSIDVGFPEVVAAHVTEKMFVMSFVDGFKVDDKAMLDLHQVDRAYLIDQITRSYAHQIFVDGFYSADPHPGNILVEIATKRAVLLDFGLTKELSEDARYYFAKLLVAAAEQGLSPVPRSRFDRLFGYVFDPCHFADIHGLLDALGGVGLRLRTDVPFDVALLAKYFFRDANRWCYTPLLPHTPSGSLQIQRGYCQILLPRQLPHTHAERFGFPYLMVPATNSEQRTRVLPSCQALTCEQPAHVTRAARANRQEVARDEAQKRRAENKRKREEASKSMYAGDKVDVTTRGRFLPLKTVRKGEVVRLGKEGATVRLASGEEVVVNRARVKLQASRSPIDAWPDAFIFFDRVLGLIRGLTASLDVSQSYLDVMTPFARKALRDHSLALYPGAELTAQPNVRGHDGLGLAQVPAFPPLSSLRLALCFVDAVAAILCNGLSFFSSIGDAFGKSLDFERISAIFAVERRHVERVRVCDGVTIRHELRQRKCRNERQLCQHVSDGDNKYGQWDCDCGDDL